MRERTRFENELLALGLREALPESALRQAFEVDEQLAYEAREGKIAPEPYRITGGHYSPKEKAYAVQDGKGLILTVPSVIGKEERKLERRAPAPILVNKETWRFEGGRLGNFVQDFNEFTFYFYEVLRAIGRLRDLLSAGAPEAPTDLTKVQKQAFRPTDDQKAASDKKDRYDQWRKAQKEYAVLDDRGLIGGRVGDVVKAAKEFSLARSDRWQVQGEMERLIAEAKRLKHPKFKDIEITFGNIVTAVNAAANAASGGLAAGAAMLVDKLIEARKARIEYDMQVKHFSAILKHMDKALQDTFEKFTSAADRYFIAQEVYQRSFKDCDDARTSARHRAALLGQILAPDKKAPYLVLSAIRMPVLVADAWRTLAIIGPQALKKHSSLITSIALVDRANTYFKLSKPDPYGFYDITNVVKAYKIVDNSKHVLMKEDVEEWIAINKLWDEFFNNFYR